MNKRGFAVTTMLYGLTVMGFLIVILLMSIMSNNRVNTKDIVNNIEKDMNSHTATSKNGNIPINGMTSGFKVPQGESGIYKVELWGTHYVSRSMYLEENIWIYFRSEENAGETTSKAILPNANRIGTTEVGEYKISSSEVKGGNQNNGIDLGEFQQNSNYESYKPKAYVSPNSFGNGYFFLNLDDPSPRYSIRQIARIDKDKYNNTTEKNTIFKYPSEFNSGKYAANYYLMTVDSSGYNTNQALTRNQETGEVSIKTFDGSLNQQWNFKKIGTGKDGLFQITNSATGKALESATETVNNVYTGGIPELIANNQITRNNKFQRWYTTINDPSHVFVDCGDNYQGPGGHEACIEIRPENLNPAGYLKYGTEIIEENPNLLPNYNHGAYGEGSMTYEYNATTNKGKLISTTTQNVRNSFVKMQYWDNINGDWHWRQPDTTTGNAWTTGDVTYTVEKDSSWTVLRFGIDGSHEDACVSFDLTTLPHGTYTLSFHVDSMSADGKGNRGVISDIKLEEGSVKTRGSTEINYITFSQNKGSYTNHLYLKNAD